LLEKGELVRIGTTIGMGNTSVQARQT